MQVTQSEAASNLPSRFYFCLGLAFVLVVSAIAYGNQERGIDFLPLNPSGEIARTTVAFWEGKWSNRPYYTNLARSLEQASAQNPEARYWQDVFTLDRHDRLVPKHCVALSLLAMPFYALFGTAGFWILNQLLLFGVFFGVYSVSREFSSELSALLTVMVFAVTTFVLRFSYNLSYDLLGTLAVLFSVRAILQKRPIASGLFFAMSLACRVSHLFFLPMLFMLCERNPKAYKQLLRGLTCGWFPLLLFQGLIWGAPVLGPYAHLVSYVAGKAVPDQDSHYFSGTVFVENAQMRLFAPEYGLLRQNSILWLLPFLALAPWASPRRKELNVLLLAALAYSVLMLSYSQWETSGSRFVLPSIALLMPLLAVGLTRASVALANLRA